MADNEISLSVADCFDKEIGTYVGEMPEFTLDTFLKDGALKDFPIFSAISSVYRLGKSWSEFAYLKKLIAFINGINNGIADEQKRSDYTYKIKTNEQFKNREMEYILVILDRYIGIQKPDMLAKLYLAYLEGTILWQEFAMYAEVIDRFLPGDYSLLSSSSKYTTIRNIGAEPLFRLMSQGLIVERANNSIIQEHGNGSWGISAASMKRAHNQERNYYRTEFGEQLVSILGSM